MRLDTSCIGIVVVAGNPPRRVHATGLEYDIAGCITNGQMHPDAPRRIPGWQLVPGEIAHRNLSLEAPADDCRTCDDNLSGLG